MYTGFRAVKAHTLSKIGGDASRLAALYTPSS
jgi:hypothetical protein